MNERIVFIGGGNMASAMIGGMLRQGFPAEQLDVVDPLPSAQEQLRKQFGIRVTNQGYPALEQATLVIWAVKPQSLKEATIAARLYTRNALHLSVAAGVRSDTIAQWLDNQHVVRAMPNTPALIGKGISALFARAAVSEPQRRQIERIAASTGEYLWLSSESQLDAATAISGSGPAYMFYFMETMTAAGIEMGLTHEQAYKLTVATFIGAGELARTSSDPPEILRQRVTSKGGTTHAAITSMEDNHLKHVFTTALHAAQHRAKEMGDTFGQE
ncbi:MAG: pyrroline-5-carboxylate reductase [Rhodoferax sp.]|nr:pyrroline-5-carboxylate reductase [Rhodoferax sp.]